MLNIDNQYVIQIPAKSPLFGSNPTVLKFSVHQSMYSILYILTSHCFYLLTGFNDIKQ